MPLFPLGDDNPTRTRPVFTWLLIAVNVAVYLMFNFQFDSDEAQQRWDLAWGYDVARPLSVQLLTSMFMHGNFLHLLGNMWVLWIMGDNVEDKLGRLRYLVLYFLGGAVAALTYAGIARYSPAPAELVAQLGGREPPLVGASGAIAAVMGVYLVFFPEARIRLLFFWFWVIPVRAKWFIGMTLALDLFTSLRAQEASVGGIATMAHVGGGVFGILCALAPKPIVGGGGEGDVWDVHTGFAKRPDAQSQRWNDERMPSTPFVSPAETDEVASSEMENAITHLVRGGRVREAIDVYPSYVAMPREQPLPADVQMEIAHEFYRQWLPREAVPAYLRFLETHPDAPDAPEAKFRLGMLHARGTGQRDEARKWLTAAMREHRDSRIRDAAGQQLAALGR